MESDNSCIPDNDNHSNISDFPLFVRGVITNVTEHFGDLTFEYGNEANVQAFFQKQHVFVNGVPVSDAPMHHVLHINDIVDAHVEPYSGVNNVKYKATLVAAVTPDSLSFSPERLPNHLSSASGIICHTTDNVGVIETRSNHLKSLYVLFDTNEFYVDGKKSGCSNSLAVTFFAKRYNNMSGFYYVAPCVWTNLKPDILSVFNPILESINIENYVLHPDIIYKGKIIKISLDAALCIVKEEERFMPVIVLNNSFSVSKTSKLLNISDFIGDYLQLGDDIDLTVHKECFDNYWLSARAWKYDEKDTVAGSDVRTVISLNFIDFHKWFDALTSSCETPPVLLSSNEVTVLSPTGEPNTFLGKVTNITFNLGFAEFHFNKKKEQAFFYKKNVIINGCAIDNSTNMEQILPINSVVSMVVEKYTDDGQTKYVAKSVKYPAVLSESVEEPHFSNCDTACKISYNAQHESEDDKCYKLAEQKKLLNTAGVSKMVETGIKMSNNIEDTGNKDKLCAEINKSCMNQLVVSDADILGNKNDILYSDEIERKSESTFQEVSNLVTHENEHDIIDKVEIESNGGDNLRMKNNEITETTQVLQNKTKNISEGNVTNCVKNENGSLYSKDKIIESHLNNNDENGTLEYVEYDVSEMLWSELLRNKFKEATKKYGMVVTKGNCIRRFRHISIDVEIANGLQYKSEQDGFTMESGRFESLERNNLSASFKIDNSTETAFSLNWKIFVDGKRAKQPLHCFVYVGMPVLLNLFQSDRYNPEEGNIHKFKADRVICHPMYFGIVEVVDDKMGFIHFLRYKTYERAFFETRKVLVSGGSSNTNLKDILKKDSPVMLLVDFSNKRYDAAFRAFYIKVLPEIKTVSSKPTIQNTLSSTSSEACEHITGLTGHILKYNSEDEGVLLGNVEGIVCQLSFSSKVVMVPRERFSISLQRCLPRSTTVHFDADKTVDGYQVSCIWIGKRDSCSPFMTLSKGLTDNHQDSEESIELSSKSKSDTDSNKKKLTVLTPSTEFLNQNFENEEILSKFFTSLTIPTTSTSSQVNSELDSELENHPKNKINSLSPEGPVGEDGTILSRKLGIIDSYVSEDLGMLRYNFNGVDKLCSFDKRVVCFPENKTGLSLKAYLPIGQEVYFNGVFLQPNNIDSFVLLTRLWTAEIDESNANTDTEKKIEDNLVDLQGIDMCNSSNAENVCNGDSDTPSYSAAETKQDDTVVETKRVRFKQPVDNSGDVGEIQDNKAPMKSESDVYGCVSKGTISHLDEDFGVLKVEDNREICFTRQFAFLLGVRLWYYNLKQIFHIGDVLHCVVYPGEEVRVWLGFNEDVDNKELCLSELVNFCKVRKMNTHLAYQLVEDFVDRHLPSKEEVLVSKLLESGSDNDMNNSIAECVSGCEESIQVYDSEQVAHCENIQKNDEGKVKVMHQEISQSNHNVENCSIKSTLDNGQCSGLNIPKNSREEYVDSSAIHLDKGASCVQDPRRHMYEGNIIHPDFVDILKLKLSDKLRENSDHLGLSLDQIVKCIEDTVFTKICDKLLSEAISQELDKVRCDDDLSENRTNDVEGGRHDFLGKTLLVDEIVEELKERVLSQPKIESNLANAHVTHVSDRCNSKDNASSIERGSQTMSSGPILYQNFFVE